VIEFYLCFRVPIAARNISYTAREFFRHLFAELIHARAVKRKIFLHVPANFFETMIYFFARGE